MKRIEEVVLFLLVNGKNVFLTEEGWKLLEAAFPSEKGETANA
jgi:hypothetical protein